MKRDLKLNMSHLDAISRKVQSYIDAMEAVGLAARKFEQTIKDQDSDAYNKLSEQWETNVWENEKILKYRLGVIKEMIDSYISDMTDYIAPENETAMMRVDRNDIWWNYKQIEGEATSFDWIVQDTGSTLATYKRLFIPNPFSSDEENEAKKSAQQQEEDAESARRQRNYEKLQGFRDQLDTSIREKISDSVDEIRKIYENKVIPFENTDDSYKSKMSAYYSEWSSMGDKFSDAGNAIRDFLAGIGDSLVDTVKGLLTLVVDLGILYVDVRWKSIVPIQVPEVLDQEVEKIKQKYEPLLKDPVNTIGGIGQSICDTADEKGVAYSSGYIVTEVVTALLADKRLDKIKNVAKTGKTADNVADIAEGAAKGAGNAAEDAGKAGKGLEEAAKGAESAAEDAGKVVGSGLNSIDNTAITHSYLGDFTYNPKTGAVSKMKGGGHGQANIEFLEANGLEYNIVKVYDNGVRIGNIPDHKVKAKRTGTNQSWFPESWSESDIANAGAYIGNLPENVNVADGVTVFGNYNGVRVGVIRTNGRISTIFPDAASQP